MRATLDGERLLIETRDGKVVAELSMELFDGLLHAASDMAKEAGLDPGLVIGTTIQLLRTLDERTDSIPRHGTGPAKN
jgi:hypothetical protein